MRKPKGISALVLVILVVVILIILSGGFFFLRDFLPESNKNNPELENAIANTEEQFAQRANANQNSNTAAATNTTVNANTNTTTVTSGQELVGTWTSDCLVPDVNSPWSEKHQFVIKADGTAVHTRWSSGGHDCSPEDTLVNDYQYTIPGSGQINLTDLDAGATIYDIYQITGSNLLFGHGFQAKYPAGYDATQGNSSGHRFYVLNSYIVYHKQ